MANKEVVILSGCRTPIASFGQSLKDIRAYQLAAIVMEEAMKRAGVIGDMLDDVIFGDCVQTSAEANTARTAALKAGIPIEVPATTIQRQCASGMQAAIFGSQQIIAGDSEFVLVGGCESMSNAPYVVHNARWGLRLTHGEFTDSMWELLHSGSQLLGEAFIMGQTAENLAKKYNISRQDQDQVAFESHKKAIAAIDGGKFKDEIVPVPVPQRKGEPKMFTTDEHPRRDITMESLAALKPAFDKKNGTVTAGNSSGLNDGAAAMVLTSMEKAGQMGRKPLARIAGNAIAGCEPHLMGYGPVPAVQKLLKKTGKKLDDIGLIECNEAFAAQYLSVERGLGLDRSIVNVNGSGIALGHPVGCTGARIIISLISEMKRRDIQWGIATLCVGGGMGGAVLIENLK
ncbi:MAG TPA: acetyl-CoA C-acetyltransferase [Spirochaetota bacterium]|nr:acetyl-CoA C-acetyltransferase [Spirochaetota bacterium]HPC39928.1 acetyl-CoA C-acetyltransferase [Spirochaetota bacterium]HQF10328.1 acetyl-CoA C-acetyltransferase [Spirochaetota bacterium]HQH97822.1 acetyl-CoA C-acetyltransferase [Spirochaetota bacterium]HQJ71546.1 acetyl-CoA C-acetyltransferase [Spirochaetota bacterium]